MTDAESALQEQAGVDASQALLGLLGSIDKDASTPELMTEQESPAHEDPINDPTNAPLRPDTNASPQNANTTAVTDEDQPTVAAAASGRPRSGTMRRKVAKRTYGSPIFAKPPPAPIAATTNTASTKNDYDKYDESSAVSSLALFRESAFRPLTETAAIIESEMGVASLEDLDMAAPMLLYSLSTSSTRNYNRKRKQREQQQEQEQHTAAEDMLLFSPREESREESVSEPEASASAPAEKPLGPSPEKKKKMSSPDKKKSVSAEKIKRTRSKPAISRKKQESMSSLDTATTKTSTTKKSANKASAHKASTTKTTKKKARAGQYAKKVAASSDSKRSYVKKTSGVPMTVPPSDSGPTAFNSKGTVKTLPPIRPDIVLPWPMKGETFPSLHPNDVLSGRGNGVAIYPGNRQFREFIRLFKDRYVRAYRNEKGTVAADVIKTVLSLNPPGRFVEKANKTGTEFQLVDYSRALEKTSQALREGSAALRVMVFKDMDKADKAMALVRKNHQIAMAGGVPVLEEEKGKAAEKADKARADKARALEKVQKARTMDKAREWAKGKVEEKE